MDLSSFLQSGLLESYALSQCSPEEQQLVEDMLARHAEARAELQKIELALEQFAATQAVTPPAWMRGRIEELVHQNAPSTTVLNGRTGGSATNFWTLALGVIALGCAALYFSRTLETKKLNTALNQAKTELQDCETRNKAQQNLQEQVAHLIAPDTKPVPLESTVNDPSAQATVYYNANTKTAYLSPTALPALSADRDYQLWVITTDKPQPQPLNVFSNTADLLEANAFAGQAVAFAISEEPKGGSPNGVPTKVVMLRKVG